MILGDAFETIVLPRRVIRRIRLARLFFRYTWLPFSAWLRWISSENRRETYLSFYGPLSLLLLLMVWATGLIFGFALLHWANGSAIDSAKGMPGFGTDLYFSGTTFFTLGLGDVVPRSSLARGLTALEAGMGLGFLAMVIGYLPALNQSFSRREVNISLLDARGGSPPTAAEMLRRHSYDQNLEELRQLLQDWELWSAELLESHLSYPVLAYFRSQHENQSWLGALTTILDTCAFVIAGSEGACARQAALTFAMARHAVVDLALIFQRPPREPERTRLPPEDLERLRANLEASGLKLHRESTADQKLTELRQMYEPYINSMSSYLVITIPPWIPEASPADNWQTSAWGTESKFQSLDAPKGYKKSHF
ncbi:MAG: potassium channel family protein [Planctomycetaceae bacterium]